MPDLTPETLAELRRRHAALTPFALSFLTGGPGGDPYIALAAEDGSQLTDAGFDAVLLFAEMASDSLPALLDVAAERDALAAGVERVRALADEWTYNGEFGWDDGSHAYGTDCVVQALDYAAAKLRRALDEEPQP